MKIVIVTALASPYQVELFEALSREIGIFVLYVFPLGGRRPWAERPASFPSVCLADGALALDEAIRRMDTADLVVFNWYRDARVRALIEARHAAGRPWVFWGEVLGFKVPWWLGRMLRRLSLRALHASRAPIWGIGSWAVQSYRREFGARRRYENVPYASDLSRFSTERTRGRSGDRAFLYSGKLNRRKGVDLLLAGAARMLRESRPFRLVLAGDGPLRPAAARLAAAYPSRVTALGFVDWNDLPRIYADCDVLVAPSRHDGWNLAVAEGLASGLPVISTEHTGAAIDLVRPHENGWSVAAGAEDALMQAMVEAAETPHLDRMSAAAHETAAAHSLQWGVRRFLECARKALGGGQSEGLEDS